MYLCLSKNSEYVENNGIYLSKSGVNNTTCNVAIIENDDIEFQQDIISNYFNCNGIIIAKDSNKNSIDKWSKDIKYLGKSILLKKQETNTSAERITYSNITVEKVKTEKQFEDFFVLFTKLKNLKPEESVTMFSKKMFQEDYFLYVAYYNGEAAGIWYMVKTLDSLMILDAFVLEKFRQLDILKAMASTAYGDAVQNKIYNYFAMVTSQFALNVALSYGYVLEDYAHLWSLDGVGGVI